MLRSAAVSMLIIIVAAASCGSTPAGPVEIAERMLEAAQARDYDLMRSYLSPEAQGEINVAALAGIEIVSFSIDEVDYSNDSTEVEIDYTITIKEIMSGETDTDDEDMDLELNSDGEWIIVNI